MVVSFDHQAMDHLRPFMLCDLQRPDFVDARAQVGEAIVGRQRLRHAASILTCSAWGCAEGSGWSNWCAGHGSTEIKIAEAVFEGARGIRIRGHVSGITRDIYWRRCRVDAALAVARFFSNNHIVWPTSE